MYCVIKCIVQGNQAPVKNADLRHPSCTVVMYKRKSASPVLNVLICLKLQTPQCFNTLGFINTIYHFSLFKLGSATNRSPSDTPSYNCTSRENTGIQPEYCVTAAHLHMAPIVTPLFVKEKSFTLKRDTSSSTKNEICNTESKAVLFH